VTPDVANLCALMKAHVRGNDLEKASIHLHCMEAEFGAPPEDIFLRSVTEVVE